MGQTRVLGGDGGGLAASPTGMPSGAAGRSFPPGHSNAAAALRRHTARLPEPFALPGIAYASATTGK